MLTATAINTHSNEYWKKKQEDSNELSERIFTDNLFTSEKRKHNFKLNYIQLYQLKIEHKLEQNEL